MSYNLPDYNMDPPDDDESEDFEEDFDDFDAANDEDMNAECVWDVK